ncbi:hypothetical protein J2S00_000437 [Caldalkalibacillus uzonensis]|uniref:Uncharacterized protein n=1 Tax=Caldalkalibacillus uzonensis TaxID=353224 RepID=A0ABU0CRL4_9BACI|nr:hypothetical protein [Caldalkalibacillus uzonensis]MDQ0337667.1 hypothetical protein [Caldalkalibacillus uzonensis]
MSVQRHLGRNQTPASQHRSTSHPNESHHYAEQVYQTLVELEQAMKNVQEAVYLLHQSGLMQGLKGGSGQNLLAQLAAGLKHIDLRQIKALLQSPFIQRMLTDPEFYQLFAPDTGQTPGTQAKLYPGHEQTATV